MISSSSFSLDIMLANLSAAFGSIQTLIVAVSYITGLALIVRGVMMYRIFANQTFGSAQRGEIAGPMVHIVVGAVLLYFPSTLDTTMTTLFGTTELSKIGDLVAYQSLSDAEKWKDISDVVVKYMKLIGLIAFVRGWIILSKMGHAGSQPGSIGKGIIHVVGGILLINVVETFYILAQTFGYTG